MYSSVADRALWILEAGITHSNNTTNHTEEHSSSNTRVNRTNSPTPHPPTPRLPTPHPPSPHSPTMHSPTPQPPSPKTSQKRTLPPPPQSPRLQDQSNGNGDHDRQLQEEGSPQKRQRLESAGEAAGLDPSQVGKSKAKGNRGKAKGGKAKAKGSKGKGETSTTGPQAAKPRAVKDSAKSCKG